MYVGCISRWVESRGRDDDKRCEGGMNADQVCLGPSRRFTATWKWNWSRFWWWAEIKRSTDWVRLPRAWHVIRCHCYARYWFKWLIAIVWGCVWFTFGEQHCKMNLVNEQKVFESGNTTSLSLESWSEPYALSKMHLALWEPSTSFVIFYHQSVVEMVSNPSIIFVNTHYSNGMTKPHKRCHSFLLTVLTIWDFIMKP